MRRLIDDFGGALALLAREIGAVDVVLPTMPHLAAEITERTANWPVAPRIVLGEEAKLAAFRNARAALAASGTVTLELALSGVPMVGAYKVSRIEEPLKYVVKAPSILLPNLILGERAIPEILQRECTPQSLAAALAALVREGAPRAAQLARAIPARCADAIAGRRHAERARGASGVADDRRQGRRRFGAARPA